MRHCFVSPVTWSLVPSRQVDKRIPILYVLVRSALGNVSATSILPLAVREGELKATEIILPRMPVAWFVIDSASRDYKLNRPSINSGI